MGAVAVANCAILESEGTRAWVQPACPNCGKPCNKSNINVFYGGKTTHNERCNKCGTSYQWTVQGV